MISIKEFTDEFRLRSYDSWNDALEAWFEAVGQMNKRGLPIPAEWDYSIPPVNPDGSKCDGTEPESPWYEMFSEFDNETIIKIAKVMDRYLSFLKFKGKNPEDEPQEI